jgi:hypothetical protein
MPFYSVHTQGSGLQSFAGAVLVRQSFSWSAFFFGPFWLVRHRLWGALLLWALAYLALAVALGILAPAAAFLIALALQILLGLEAAALCEAKLAAQGYRLTEIVAAPTSTQAEIAFFRELDAPDVAFSESPGAAL